MIATFFTISQEDMTGMISYVGDIFSDLSPILLLIVAVSLAVMVIGVIISSLRK